MVVTHVLSSLLQNLSNGLLMLITYKEFTTASQLVTCIPVTGFLDHTLASKPKIPG